MRHEFTKSVKRQALERSDGVCEATGPRYGLAAGERCTTPIGWGAVQFDHYPRGAHDPAPETRLLDNCVACCPTHNQYAANHTDKAVEAKIKRVRRRHGLDPDTRKPKPKMRSRPFAKQHRPMRSRNNLRKEKNNG